MKCRVKWGFSNIEKWIKKNKNMNRSCHQHKSRSFSWTRSTLFSKMRLLNLLHGTNSWQVIVFHGAALHTKRNLHNFVWGFKNVKKVALELFPTELNSIVVIQNSPVAVFTIAWDFIKFHARFPPEFMKTSNPSWG